MCSWLFECVIFGTKLRREVQFYLTSLDSDAQLLGRAIRKHWGIENQAHWTLDCTFAEDACRTSSFHSPRNLALLRRIALNALNCEPTYKRTLRQKMKRAAMDNDYLIQIISSCFLDKILYHFFKDVIEIKNVKSKTIR
ncbi:ISAs1 family transposase [Microcoleus sp. D3_18_C4]|uniref:ISAs1 family transposase n=1 Tax=Microcoleus sp. D3_18_C4 TaxID=3055335 RepID=UPI004040993F